MEKILSVLLVYSCMTTALWKFWTQHIAFFDCLMLWLRCTKTPNNSLMFDFQCICKLMELFLSLQLLVVTDELGVVEMLLVNLSGVETSAYSIITLYFCWSSHLPVVLYNFLIFSRHICSYKVLFLNCWSIPMATMCFPVVCTATTH